MTNEETYKFGIAGGFWQAFIPLQGAYSFWGDFMKRIVCFLFALFLMCPAAAAGESRDLPVVMYHHISADPARAGDYIVTPDILEGDLRYIAEHGYTAVSVGEILDYCAGRGGLPEKPILITFDDGQQSVLTYALPLLEKYDMCAVAAVVGAYCDAEETAPARDPEYSYLTWDEVAELAASGRFDIASHTQDMHRDTWPRRGCLPNPGESTEAYAAALGSDLAAVDAKIEAAAGSRPLAFAYPFGFHSDQTEELLAQHGYQLTLTCENRINDLNSGALDLGRYNRSAHADRAAFFKMLGIV